MDGALAMSALDKLLQSNELNFAFLAFIPTLLVTYGMFSYFQGVLGEGRSMVKKQVFRKVKRGLRDIERLILDFDRNSDEIFGLLLVHLVYIDEIVRVSAISGEDRIIILEDIEDLEKAIMDERKDAGVILTIMNRVYRDLI